MGYNKQLPRSQTSSGTELDTNCEMTTSPIANDARQIFRRANRDQLEEALGNASVEGANAVGAAVHGAASLAGEADGLGAVLEPAAVGTVIAPVASAVGAAAGQGAAAYQEAGGDRRKKRSKDTEAKKWNQANATEEEQEKEYSAGEGDQMTDPNDPDSNLAYREFHGEPIGDLTAQRPELLKRLEGLTPEAEKAEANVGPLSAFEIHQKAMDAHAKKAGAHVDWRATKIAGR
ncbi:MAG TPA: hypothetical protein VKS44_15730 [Candidatus Acidoferrales bacterium]|nr:hypothetical protein [Candidatus Acidoferrales bacterium]